MNYREAASPNNHPAGPLPGSDEISSPLRENTLEGASRPPSVHRRWRSISRLTWILAGFWILGILASGRRILTVDTIERANPIQITNSFVDAAFRLVAFGLAGLLATAFLDLMGQLVESFNRRSVQGLGPSEADRWIGIVDRLSASIQHPAGEAGGVVEVAPRQRAAIVEIRKAIESEAWDDVVRLTEELRSTDPSDPDLARLTEEFERGRQEAIDRRLRMIEVAKEVSDGGRVLELFQELEPLLDLDALKGLETELARWFMTLVQRRLRTGIIQPEVVSLATQISEVFAGTIEGASLRASLPTLRRAVGLCPRCGGPYTGVENACPECLIAK